MTPITLFHNPACGTSRIVLALIRNSGVEPRLVESLKQPPGRDELIRLLVALTLIARDLLPDPSRGPFSKVDGEPVVDVKGRRVVR